MRTNLVIIFGSTKYFVLFVDMAYLYRHIRTDLNVPFYIGVGLTDNTKKPYRRAFDKCGRHRSWKGIVKKTAYEVEIMLDDITPEQAHQKEIEFIALYKRINHGGTLVNHTDGGEGGLNPSLETRALMRAKKLGKSPANKGVPMSEEQKKKVSLAKKGCPAYNKGKKSSEETRLKLSLAFSGNKHPLFGKPATEERKRNIGNANRGRPSHNKGKKISAGLAAVWSQIQIKKRKPILQFKDGILVGEFESLWQLKMLGYLTSGIHRCLRGVGKTSQGYTWKYKNPHA